MKILSEELKGYAKNSSLAPEFSTSSVYAVGDVVMYEGLRYRCMTAVSTAGAFNPSNWTQENVQTAVENAANHSYVFNTPVQTTSTTDETDDTISVELANRAMNIVQLATTVKYLNITFPQITTGYSRDFFVRLVITGDVPTISFSEYGGGLPDFDIADDVWSNMKQGVNIILFTETSQA